MRGSPVSAWGLTSTSPTISVPSFSFPRVQDYRGELSQGSVYFITIYKAIPSCLDLSLWIGLASCSVPDRANCYLAKSKCRTLRFPPRRPRPPISNSVIRTEIRVQSILRIQITTMLDSMAPQEPWSENAPSQSRAYLNRLGYPCIECNLD